MAAEHLEPIAIVAMGGVFPKSPTLEAFWRLIKDKATAEGHIPTERWKYASQPVLQSAQGRVDSVYHAIGCMLDDLPPLQDYGPVSRQRVARLDASSRLALHVGWQVWNQFSHHMLDRKRIGIMLGNIVLPTDACSRLAIDWMKGHRLTNHGLPSALATDYSLENRHAAALPALILAEALALHGPCFTLDAACASSLYTIHLAMRALQLHELDAVLAGGLSRPDCLYTQMGFTQLRALSKRGQASPFDARADGLMVGEGAGMFVLKRLSDALSQSDAILGVVHGVGVSNDRSGKLLAPSKEGQLRAMRSAYQQAGWAIDQLDYIECHATGTPVGDAVEFDSMMTLYHEQHGPSRIRMERITLGSVKANIGHTLTAAGAAGLLKVLLAFRESTLPPQPHFNMPSRDISLEASPFRILTNPMPWKRTPHQPRRAAVSAFGFGGINAHLLIEEWTPESTRTVQEQSRMRWQKRTRTKFALVGFSVQWGQRNDFNVLFAPPKKSPTCERRESLSIPIDQFRIPPQELEEALPQQIWPLLLTRQALKQSGLSEADHTNTGVFIGLDLDLNTTNFCCRWSVPSLDDGVPLKNQVSPPLTANRTMGALGSVVASRIAREWKCGGPSFTVASGRDSGLMSLDTAIQLLQTGDIDRAIVGAVDLACEPRSMWCQTTNSSTPVHFGDACTILILERWEDAIHQPQRILAGFNEIHDHTEGESTSTNSTLQLHTKTLNTDLIVHEIGCPSRLPLHVGAAQGLFSLAIGLHALIEKKWLDLSAQPIDQPWFIDHPHEHRSIKWSWLLHTGEEKHFLAHEVSSEQAGLRVAGSPSPHWTHRAVTIIGSSLNELIQRIDVLTKQLVSTASGWSIIFDEANKATQPRSLGHLACVFLIHPHLPNEALIEIFQSSAQILRQPRHARHQPLVIKHPHHVGNSYFIHQPDPIGPTAVAFVYPGSGNFYPGMGLDIIRNWPGKLANLERQFPHLRSLLHPEWQVDPSRLASATTHELMECQVLFGMLMQDILHDAQINPAAVMGYSLGESTAFLAHRVWEDSHAVLNRLRQSSLFQSDLAGPCNVIRQAWQWPLEQPFEWMACVVQCDRSNLEQALNSEPYAYLMIINADREFVIGGEKAAITRCLNRIRSTAWPLQGVSTVHGPIVQIVSEAYRVFHTWPFTQPPTIPFYSGAWGRRYEVTSTTAANAIVDLALHPLDFPRLVRQAHEDGIRAFIEMGPGNSCSRMIQQILHNQRVRVLEANPFKQPEQESVQLLLAQLFVEGIPFKHELLFATPNNLEATSTSHRLHLPAHHTMARWEPCEMMQAGRAHLKTAGESPVIHDPASHKGTVQNFDQANGMLQSLVQLSEVKCQAHATFLDWMDRWNHLYKEALGQANTSTDEPIAIPPHDVQAPSIQLAKEQCYEFARGHIGKVFGPAFASIDEHPTRVRLPDAPLMLVDRVLAIEGEPLSLQPGRIVTEHDIVPHAWYLDGGRIPTCIAVEAGQADLMLSGYLGIDLHTQGLAVYRLLDAEVTFHAPLPTFGRTIHYDIRIEQFFKQSHTHLFRFAFEGTVDGKPLLSMNHGCAGFFTEQALHAGKGLVQSEWMKQKHPRSLPADWIEWVPITQESYTKSQIEALRDGRLSDCFGEAFAGHALAEGLALPGGRMHLIDRVPCLDPHGGRYQLGLIQAELEIHPADWFLVCHFLDDQVMPGTLMFECCCHALRIYLLRLGWISTNPHAFYSPVVGRSSKLKCRGQVIASTAKARFDIHLKELGYDPYPYAVADAILYADDKPIVEITDMSLGLFGVSKDELQREWQSQDHHRPPSTFDMACEQTKRPALFDRDRILAFAIGKPSDAFGEPYRVFDADRVIARLPGPPYQFLDRIVHIEAEPWLVKPGGWIEAEYDVPANAWYFTAQRQRSMPFAVLLEIALQPCGWLAAYVGSALTSQEDLSFRNLGGQAVLTKPVHPDTGTLTTQVKLTQVAQSLGMLIQHFSFHVRDAEGTVYQGQTYFGFFTQAALRQQMGIHEPRRFQPFPQDVRQHSWQSMAAFLHSPIQPLRMVDEVRIFPSGGSYGKGFIEGRKTIDPKEWFFKAHFYQDPVWPGSLGLEAFLQSLRILAAERWQLDPTTELLLPALGRSHQWTYRGQVLPTHHLVHVEASLKEVDDANQSLAAEGWLTVDDLTIYHMQDFAVQVESIKSTAR